MQVSRSLDLATRLVHYFRPLWIEAGNMETSLLAKRLSPIDRPIFITGLARSGSTLLLEFLAAHAHVATHQYRDFPFIFTPYFSRSYTTRFARSAEKKERAHGDRMMVSPQSPEAMEEMLWQAFTKHDEHFARFYREHIQKLLLASNRDRYAAKNNNLLLRLPKLLQLFPDARIIVPLRDPVSHIGSLMRQHQRFLKAANHPRAVRHLAVQGHYEFGPTRQWSSDDEITGWAHEWNLHYQSLLPYLGKENILLMPFERLCTEPSIWLTRVQYHAQLAPDTTLVEQFAATIQPPDYYESGITPQDADRIRSLTQDIHTNLMKSVVL